MKKYIFIISIIILGLLPSCYESGYVEIDNDNTIGGLRTLPPEISQFSVGLRGEFGQFSPESVFYQVGRSEDLSGNKNLIFKLGADEIEKNRLDGTYYYRICAASGTDTVYAPNVESFTFENQIIIKQKVTSTTAFLSFTSYIRSDIVEIIMSQDKEFEEQESYKTRVEETKDGMYEYSTTIEGLRPGTKYFAKASLDVLLGTLESDVVTFTTESYLRIGDVTYTDWNRMIHPMQEWYGQFTANYLSGNSYGEGSERNFDVYYYNDEWKISRDILAVGDADFVGFYSNIAQNSEDKLIIKTQNYNDNVLVWGTAHEDNGEININLRNMLSRVVLHLSLEDDYPENMATIQGFKISGNGECLPTKGIFNVNSGRFEYDWDSFDKPLEYHDNIILEKYRTVDVVLYSLPCARYYLPYEEERCTGTITFNSIKFSSLYGDCSLDEGYIPVLDLGWESGNTYEYYISFGAKSLIISDVIVNLWNPTEGGSIIVKP